MEAKPVYRYKGYDIFVSDKYPKKYYAKVGNRKVYFGDQRYQQYRDVIGRYASLDHLDKERRKNFRSRHGYKGPLDLPGTARWFAIRLLW